MQKRTPSWQLSRRKKKVSRVLLFLTVSLCIVSNLTAESDIALQRRLDRYVLPYVEAGDFSGVVLIARGDTILARKAYGFASRGDHVRNDVETRFRIASLSKTFTAAAILMLVDAGKLTLASHLSEFIQGVPNGESITIEQLLMHTSGLGALDSPEVFTKSLPMEELLLRIKATSPEFAPGAGDGYSNEGYLLLAAVIERVSGLSYSQFVARKITKPLGMRHTVDGLAFWKVPHRASAYVAGPGMHDVTPLLSDEVGIPGAGSLSSTADDLHRWAEAVRSDRVMRLDAQRYPYGWGKRQYAGHDCIEQSGLLEGFNAYLAIYPADNIDIVFLSNIQSGMFNRVAKDLAAVVFGGTTTTPPNERAAPITDRQLGEVAGSYKASSIPLPQNLVVKNRALYLQWGHYPFLRPLSPIGDDRFFYRSEYAIVQCEHDSGGKISGLKWTWDGADPVTFQRTP